MKKRVLLGIFLPLFFVSLSCHATEYFTEEFFGDFDLDGLSITFTPVPETTNYTAKAFSITELPISAGITIISLSDDDSDPVTLGSNKKVILYGVEYSSFHVGSNGHITFNTAHTSWGDHFVQPRISGFNADLNPSSGGGGDVKRRQLTDRMVITYSNVEEYNVASNVNTFQIEMFFDGRIRMSWLGMDSDSAVVGLSQGGGTIPPDFIESDLSGFEWDTDDDGMPNFWEILYFAGTTNGLPGNDFDLDGLTNLEEYIADTNPTNSSSVFRATQTNLVGGSGCVIGWTAAEGRVYTVRTASNLVSDDFSVLQSGITYPVNAYTSTVDQAQQFFKVDVVFPE